MRETGSFAGTRIEAVVDALDGVYADIERTQKPWRDASPFPCPDGCGSCCVDFEPDVLECEALYLAAWMLFHQRERALAILDGTFVSPRPDTERGCVLFDPANPYHCTVYGGRCLICRLFGYTGDRGKDGGIRWKPCRFLPHGSGAAVERRQYRAAELFELFGAAPAAMGDITAQISALVPDSAEERLSLREALPRAISKILMLERFIGGSTDPDEPDPNAPDPDAPEPNPDAPIPRAS